MSDHGSYRIPPADEAAWKRRQEIIENGRRELAILRERRKRALAEAEVALKLKRR